MCPDAHDAGAGATVRPYLPVFHEEVDTSPRPLKPSRAGSERTSTAHSLRERTEQHIKPLKIRDPTAGLQPGASFSRVRFHQGRATFAKAVQFRRAWSARF